MMRILSGVVLVGGLVMVALPVAAQRKASGGAVGPRQEFGVDITALYDKPSGVSGGIMMGVPVDLRVTFLGRSKILWEPRLTFTLNSVGGTTNYIFTPGLNAQYLLKRGSGPGNLLRAPYVTGGVALNVIGGGGSSATQFSLGGGVGTRAPAGNAALRYEGFLGYTFKGGGLPSSFAIGARMGFSFWH